VAGQAAGDSIDQQAKRLEAVIANPKRAMTIARTEVGAASQMAQLESMTQSGVVDGKTWFSQLDGAVRDSHQISGQTVRIEQNFKLLSGRTARIPRDPNLPPEDRANCRCFVGHKFIDEDEEL